MIEFAIPTVTVLQDISRSLLTLGVGLFLGYIVLIIGSNILGLIPRYIAKLFKRRPAQHATAKALPQGKSGWPVQVSSVAISSSKIKEDAA